MQNIWAPELSFEDYTAFGRHFGELAVDPYVEPPFPETQEVMSLIREADETAYNFGGDWHSDGSYLERPGGVTILWGKDVPPYGGDTLFSIDRPQGRLCRGQLRSVRPRTD